MHPAAVQRHSETALSEAVRAKEHRQHKEVLLLSYGSPFTKWDIALSKSFPAKAMNHAQLLKMMLIAKGYWEWYERVFLLPLKSDFPYLVHHLTIQLCFINAAGKNTITV